MWGIFFWQYALFGTVWMCGEPFSDDSYMYHTVWTCGERCSDDSYVSPCLDVWGTLFVPKIGRFIHISNCLDMWGTLFGQYTLFAIVWTRGEACSGNFHRSTPFGRVSWTFGLFRNLGSAIYTCFTRLFRRSGNFELYTVWDCLGVWGTVFGRLVHVSHCLDVWRTLF